MLKVRGGKYLHRILKEPPSEITRPTKDMVKEGMFNSLGNIYGESFLDLFGGSGAIGIEAYSRGAQNVTINDSNKEALKVIKGNLETLQIKDINVTSLDYVDAIKKYSSLGLNFDNIFLDPPYKLVVDLEFIKTIVDAGILAPNGVIVIETDYDLDERLFELYKIRLLKYGRSRIYILR